MNLDHQFEICTRREAMDVGLIHSFLAQSYWARGIPVETLKKAMDHSLCFGLFTEKNRQVAFARVVTDKATFAYLADVFVVPAFQGKRLSRILLQSIVDHPDLQGLRRVVLATQDAHGLYEKFGFKPLATPEIFMEIWSPGTYD